jgi:DNA-binding NarL/FixJ family response regulator
MMFISLHVADKSRRAEIADVCEDAGIAVASPPFAGEKQVDVVLTDRPVETDRPMIVLASGENRETWPANVRAMVPTDIDAETLVAIIRVVAAGYALMLDKDRVRRDDGSWADPGDAADQLVTALSAREREVLSLLAEGASNKEIARALALSVHTVKYHLASLMQKLGASSRVEAVAIAMRVGLVMV